jgi:hypothetical protein
MHSPKRGTASMSNASMFNKTYNGWLCSLFRMNSDYEFPATGICQLRLS